MARLRPAAAEATDRTVAWVAACLIVGVVGLSAFVRPDLESRSEAKFYLASARALVAQDESMDHRLEPGYPAFLAVLIVAGLEPEVWTPVAQTATFIAALFLFLQAAVGGSTRTTILAVVAASIAYVPTFLITVNGAVFTESVSASAVLVLLASLVRLWHNLRLARAGLSSLGWLTAAIASSAFLGLTKGSFSFVALVFLPLLVLLLRVLGGTCLRASATFLAGCTLACLAAHVAVKVWLHPSGLDRFLRAGQIIYGRSAYASQFDFRRNTIPYLVAAFSDAACVRLWGDRCANFRFDAENRIGELLRRQGVSDDLLWRQGWWLVRKHPVRALAFVPLELSRLVVHHTTRGFATLEIPVLGELTRSASVLVCLKFLNLLVYVAPLVCLTVLHRGGGGVRAAWWGLPEETRVAAVLTVAYCVAYLAVHSLATVILRMVYPIAVLPLLLAIGTSAVTWRQTRAAASERPSAGGSSGGFAVRQSSR